MNILQVVDTMSNDMYLRLKHAAETGKWPEGTTVDKAQRDTALQLSMAYQSRHLNADQMLTVGADGELVTKTKRELKAQFSEQNKAKEIVPCHDNQKKEKDNTAMQNDIARFTDL